jgi:hypothetical protein
MQIHIHKDGKTFGPYPIEQVRQYLKARNFSGNDLACYDGANWIKLSQVPGVTPTKPKTVAKQVEQPAKVETKPAKKLLGSIDFILVSFLAEQKLFFLNFQHLLRLSSHLPKFLACKCFHYHHMPPSCSRITLPF